MKNPEFKYREFVNYVHTEFKERIELDELKEILHLEEDYGKDNPQSLGKHLVLRRLRFSGRKKDDIEFVYDQPLYSGINVWIADNFKGKSSIFKIIKFALTGIESYKNDINKWLKEVLLEFQIGEVVYTIYIDKIGRDRGALYSFGIDKFLQLRENQKLDGIDKDKEFDFRSKKMLEEHIQEFFFDHFSFYTLRYTHKNSSKEKFELNTAALSWATYFKSIYLESSNYKYLFFEEEKIGAQGKKIFEMILGLPLTYPINMLGVQSDRVSEQIGKIRLAEKSKKETTKSEEAKIKKRYADVSENLKKLREGGDIHFDDKPLIREYTQIQERLNENRKRNRIVRELYQVEKDKIEPLEAEIRNLESDKKKINDEINRLLKQESNVELYKEAGSFFSNLDIKVCPHCEFGITEGRRENERHKHECSLCGQTSTQQKIENEELQAKIVKIKEERSGHEKKLEQLNSGINQQRIALKELRSNVASIYNKIVSIPSTETDAKRLNEIEARIEEINTKRRSQQKLIEKEQDLIKEEAVLKFQLDEIEKEKDSEDSEQVVKLELRKAILTYALKALERKRVQMNEGILGKLEALILNEIQAFGLNSIDRIKINDKYQLVFTQNEVSESFEDLTEGEKLRVKLAFYLSLIQLDIEHSLGRHPRFLIFDSPGSEEMIQDHLHGLVDILKSVNERFKDEMQIFVGSALREFSQITDDKKAVIKGKDESIF